MLTKRQIHIFLEFCGQENTYLKANHFADELNVSLRTIQNDIKAIKSEFAKEPSFVIESKVPFGTRVSISDHDAFHALIAKLENENESSTTDKEGRIHKLIIFLLNQRKSVRLSTCADYIFVSKSTLLNDLKDCETILKNHSLRLIQSVGYLWIDGLERDKRMCLIELDQAYIKIASSNPLSTSETNRLDFIKKTITQEFLDKKYSISDVEFQNIVIWINISIKRIDNFFYLNEEDIDDEMNYAKEIEIATNIYSKIEKHFYLRVPQPEINFLALYISNHSNFSDADYISDDLNSFIVEALRKIHDAYPTDFTHDMTLRMELALHCVALISRARNNVQIKNEMLDYIKQTFSYAFEIATYFSYLLSDKYHIRIKESETAFLAIYFNKSILEQTNMNGTKRICIITNLQRSQYFLLEQFLYEKLQKYISSIDFVTSQELENEDLDKYDVFFSTEDNHAVEIGLATKIHFFPDENEFEKIRARIEGFKNIEDTLDLFDPRLFAVKDFNTKAEVQNWLVSKASHLYNVENLSQEIELREEFGSTYFGNGIAILHPLHSTVSDSFIGEIILKKHIVWDSEGNHVKVVFLLCIERSNLEAFKAWDFLSPALFTSDFRKEVSTIHTFNQFKKLCETKLKSQIINRM